ncbi:MAG: LptF/LptG family permease [Candidatus Omnitrophota bacterium]
MKIIRTYILKDFFITFIFSLLFASLLMLLINLMMASQLVLQKGVNMLDALKMCSPFLVNLLRYTLPFSFLFGILLSMGRVISDNEIVAINVAGISSLKLLQMFLILGFILSLCLYILNDKVDPYFHYMYRTQMKTMYSKNINALIEPGTFLESFPNYILYVSDKDGNKLKNVFVYEVNDKEGISRVTYAKKGEFVVEKNILKMKLENGFRDENSSDKKKELYRLNFQVFFVDLPISDKKNVKIEKKPADMRVKELIEKIDYLQKKGISPLELFTELHKRVSLSFSMIVFTLLGFGVSLLVRHREKSINFGIAAVTAMSYFLLFIPAEALIEYRKITPLLGMWLPNIIIGSIGIYILSKNAHFR